MSVVITKEDLIAYAEVDYVLKHMNERYREKVPENLRNFFETIKDPDYKIHIEPYKPLQNQGLTKYALEIIALLHIKYWCQNQERKEELLDKMKQNQEKLEAKLREQFSTDKLFQKNTHKVQVNQTSTQDPMTTAYSKYMENNPDIQDYTDLREEQQISQELQGNVIQEQTSLFQKIKLFVSKIFHKTTD